MSNIDFSTSSSTVVEINAPANAVCRHSSHTSGQQTPWLTQWSFIAILMPPASSISPGHSVTEAPPSWRSRRGDTPHTSQSLCVPNPGDHYAGLSPQKSSHTCLEDFSLFCTMINLSSAQSFRKVTLALIPASRSPVQGCKAHRGSQMLIFFWLSLDCVLWLTVLAFWLTKLNSWPGHKVFYSSPGACFSFSLKLHGSSGVGLDFEPDLKLGNI